MSGWVRRELQHQTSHGAWAFYAALASQNNGGIRPEESEALPTSRVVPLFRGRTPHVLAAIFSTRHGSDDLDLCDCVGFLCGLWRLLVADPLPRSMSQSKSYLKDPGRFILRHPRRSFMATQTYWRGKRPSDARRWQGADTGEILSLAKYSEPLFHMYRGYAKQWNEIELDEARNLSEQTHRVNGARVVGAHEKFVLHCDISREDGWILEMKFARGFRRYYPGWSCGLNALRKKADIQRAILHWRGDGRAAFDAWLVQERAENEARGEWTEYRS